MATLKAGDRLPVAAFSIARADGTELGFASADVGTITIVARKEGQTTPAFQSEVTDWEMNVGETAITGTYAWGDGETDEPGRYDIEIRVELVDGRAVTFPNDQHDRLTITPALYDE